MNHDAEAMLSSRKRLKLTQAEFSCLMGVHPITVSKWERGLAEPTPWQYLLATSFRTPSPGERIDMLLAQRGPILTIADLLKYKVA